MAQLLPDKERQKPLAYLLLVVALILVYWMGFRWFFDRHGDLNEQIEQLRTNDARFQGLVAQRAGLEAQIEAVEAFETDNDYFLKAENVSLGSAELTNRLKELIRAHGNEENCQVISNQNMRVREQECFERVTNKVRLRCEVDDLTEVMYYLETGTPYIFVDNLSIYRQITRRRQGRETVQQRILDVRFDLSGYLRGTGDVTCGRQQVADNRG
ncbi:MAG: type II secretion system protein GspM [Xanthomonadales bacterium]|nr:type II secretion system protein GspM [Xanthomonadales bacterium]